MNPITMTGPYWPEAIRVFSVTVSAYVAVNGQVADNPGMMVRADSALMKIVFGNSGYRVHAKVVTPTSQKPLTKAKDCAMVGIGRDTNIHNPNPAAFHRAQRPKCGAIVASTNQQRERRDAY